MNDLEEALVLTAPARLSVIHPAVNRVLAWCRLHGHTPADLQRVELPLVEALNNAVEHGSANREDAVVKVTARLEPDSIVVTVEDPGHFVPPPNWTELPEDPLDEGGRGGFIINAGTDHWEQINNEQGHTLLLRWDIPSRSGLGIETAADAENTIDHLTEDLANSFETLLGLTHFTGLLATSASFSQLLDKVQERLTTILAHDALLVRFVEEQHLVLHPLGAPQEVPTKLPMKAAFAECKCASERRPLVGNRSNLGAEDPLATFAAQLSVLTIEFGGKTLGSLAVCRKDKAHPFSSGEVELLQAVADFIGIAKATDNLWQERNEQLRLEQEIKVAAGIQRSLLPATFPTNARWSVHGECRPAREVGGDYFDVVELSDGSLLLLVADVMGKGVPASLLAAMLRSSLRALAIAGSSPGVILTGINSQLFPDLVGLGMFITAVLVHLPSEAAGVPVFANAGHCAPVVFRTDGSLLEPSGGDVPLGVLPDTTYTDHALPIGVNERVLLYTDGCFELPGPDGVMLTAPWFLKFASDFNDLPGPDFVTALLNPGLLHIDPTSISDDRTLLVANFRP